MLDLGEIKPFFDTLATQTRTVIDLSAAGIAVIIVTWLRTIGVLTDQPEMGRFKRPSVLVIPLIGFGSSVLCGYIIGQMTVGFYLEIGIRTDLSTGRTIVSAIDHFKTQYQSRLTMGSIIQLAMSTIGIVSIVAWFVVNVVRMPKKTCNDRREIE